MKITRAHITNFRLLQDADIAIDDEATMIVGRNNSGKTSVVEVFRKFFGSDLTKFTFDDLSMNAHSEINAAYLSYVAAGDAQAIGDEAEAAIQLEAAGQLPAIGLTVTVKYEVEDDLTSLSPFIMDLDEQRTDATVSMRYAIKDPIGLFHEYQEVNAKTPIDLIDYVRKVYRSVSEARSEAIDAQDPTSRRSVTESQLKALLSVRFIYAQNQFDDLSSDRNHALSKGFESFYNSNKDDNSAAEEIDMLLTKASGQLDIQYKGLFKDIFTDLSQFGVDRMRELPLLSIVAELETLKVLSGSTRLYYGDTEGRRLPEAHNGLGYSKLIFTILQFIGFYEELRRAKPRPAMQLIFVEEPEAHLHPQMQYVFVKNIRSFVESKSDWHAQTVITTHSSHVVAESGFECIRYFDNSVTPLEVRNLSTFKVRQKRSEPGKAALKFLKQYMVLGHCDMFFADKVVLIEGTVERLLLPEMIKKVAPALQSEYVSVIEVGGAYAHLFRGVLEFLNVQTLVITDIDSVDPAAHRAAVPVSKGMVSSNPTLSKWLPALTDIDELLKASAKKKQSGRVRVAYQIREAGATRAGRSFEEAFILKNASELGAATEISHSSLFSAEDGSAKSSSAIELDSYKTAGKITKKPDFAFDILQLPSCSVPQYIKEGLEWLSKTP